MKLAIKTIGIMTLILFFSSCFHYVKINFDRTIPPKESAKKLGNIYITSPYISIKDEDSSFFENAREDLLEESFEILSDLKLTKVKKDTLPFTISFNERKGNIISFDDINFKKPIKGVYLFSFIYFNQQVMEGYVYKKVFDPNYQAYYYKEVYEKKHVYNINVQIFLYNGNKDSVEFRKDFSTSQEFSNGEAPDEYDFVKNNFDDFLKTTFENYLPKKQKVRRNLIAR